MPRYSTYGQESGLSGLLAGQDKSRAATTGGITGKGGGNTPGPQAPNPNAPPAPTTSSGSEDMPAGAPKVENSYGQAAMLAGDQSGGAGVQAQNVGTGYTNFQSILSANAGGADQMATGIGQNAYNKATVGTPGSAWGNGLDHEGANVKDGGAELNQIQTQPGLQALLQSQYKNQAYTEGASALDSYLAGSAGGKQFASAQKAYQSSLNTPTPTAPAAQTTSNGWVSLHDARKRDAKNGLGGNPGRSAATDLNWRIEHPEYDGQDVVGPTYNQETRLKNKSKGKP